MFDILPWRCNKEHCLCNVQSMFPDKYIKIHKMCLKNYYVTSFLYNLYSKRLCAIILHSFVFLSFLMQCDHFEISVKYLIVYCTSLFFVNVDFAKSACDCVRAVGESRSVCWRCGLWASWQLNVENRHSYILPTVRFYVNYVKSCFDVGSCIANIGIGDIFSNVISSCYSWKLLQINANYYMIILHTRYTDIWFPILQSSIFHNNYLRSRCLGVLYRNIYKNINHLIGIF